MGKTIKRVRRRRTTENKGEDTSYLWVALVKRDKLKIYNNPIYDWVFTHASTESEAALNIAKRDWPEEYHDKAKSTYSIVKIEKLEDIQNSRSYAPPIRKKKIRRKVIKE